MNWTGGPNAWACWSGPDILVGQVVTSQSCYAAKDRDGNGLGIFVTLRQAQMTVERAASR